MSVNDILNKVPEGSIMWLIMITATVATVFGTSYVTREDLAGINHSVQALSDEMLPLKERVIDLEYNVSTLDKRYSDVQDSIERNRKDNDELKMFYYEMMRSLERMSGNQDLTNERLEHLKHLMDAKYKR